jgi:hypothetical protein
MKGRLFLFGLLGLLLCAGIVVFRESEFTFLEVREEAAKPPRVDPAEGILRTFFAVDFAQKKIVHLTLYDLENFEEVSQPRPSLAAVAAQFGPADSVSERDLSAFGIPQYGRVHHYGRLGLVAPARGPDEVYWVLIGKGPNTFDSSAVTSSTPR